ncbi:MAG: NAD-binding protein [Candidatus Eremiobacteraeota bacterium]|nr:NAD-binding protein [Candidatus Eremiobacteraeota bacterium]
MPEKETAVLPLIVIVGEGPLAERVCAELTTTAGHSVHVLWPLSPGRRNVFERLGASVETRDPDSDEALTLAGIMTAEAILAVSDDDGLNLDVALRARFLNPGIRIVLRQFNTILGRKIEQNLEDCTVLSPAAHSAATFAATGLNPACFFALRFPEVDGPILGFVRGSAASLGLAALSIEQAEQRITGRIVAVNSHIAPALHTQLLPEDEVVLFAPIHATARRGEAPMRDRPRAEKERASGFQAAAASLRRMNPILRSLLLAAAAFFVFSFFYFHLVMGKTWVVSALDVAETITNVGFRGDVAAQLGTVAIIGAIATMLGGIIFMSIFIGYVSSALTRAQYIAMQGLRKIRTRHHVVVCGAGKIGGLVADYIAATGKPVVVIEPNPEPGLIRRARERRLDLLTGDAHSDDALTLANIGEADGVIALTNNDSVNLEIALTARALHPDVPVVVRMERSDFARATARLFGITTYSPAALSAPVIAALSRFPGTRGRVHFAGDDRMIAQRAQGERPERPSGAGVALCTWRDGRLVWIRNFEEVQPFDVVLFFTSQSRNSAA